MIHTHVRVLAHIQDKSSTWFFVGTKKTQVREISRVCCPISPATFLGLIYHPFILSPGSNTHLNYPYASLKATPPALKCTVSRRFSNPHAWICMQTCVMLFRFWSLCCIAWRLHGDCMAIADVGGPGFPVERRVRGRAHRHRTPGAIKDTWIWLFV